MSHHHIICDVIAILFIVLACVIPIILDDQHQPTLIALLVCATALLLGGCASPETPAPAQCRELTTTWCAAVVDCDATQASTCAEAITTRCPLNRTVYAPIALDACRAVLRTHTCTGTTPVFTNDPAAQMCIVFLGSWREEDTAAFDSQ